MLLWGRGTRAETWQVRSGAAAGGMRARDEDASWRHTQWTPPCCSSTQTPDYSQVVRRRADHDSSGAALGDAVRASPLGGATQSRLSGRSSLSFGSSSSDFDRNGEESALSERVLLRSRHHRLARLLARTPLRTTLCYAALPAGALPILGASSSLAPHLVHALEFGLRATMAIACFATTHALHAARRAAPPPERRVEQLEISANLILFGLRIEPLGTMLRSNSHVRSIWPPAMARDTIAFMSTLGIALFITHMLAKIASAHTPARAGRRRWSLSAWLLILAGVCLQLASHPYGRAAVGALDTALGTSAPT